MNASTGFSRDILRYALLLYFSDATEPLGFGEMTMESTSLMKSIKLTSLRLLSNKTFLLPQELTLTELVTLC